MAIATTESKGVEMWSSRYVGEARHMETSEGGVVMNARAEEAAEHYTP